MTTRLPASDQMRLPLQSDLPEGADSFVVSDCNRAAVEALADWPNLIGGVMAICGPAGSGKSRLAQMWAERVGAVAFHGGEAALVDPMEIEGRPVLLDRAMDADDETLFHLINLAQAPGGAM
ncbi:MAG: chromosomal replication initiator DnaA, partial [Brevundimonas sp.]